MVEVRSGFIRYRRILDTPLALSRWLLAEFSAASIRLAGERGVKRFAAESVIKIGTRNAAFCAEYRGTFFMMRTICDWYVGYRRRNAFHCNVSIHRARYRRRIDL